MSTFWASNDSKKTLWFFFQRKSLIFTKGLHGPLLKLGFAGSSVKRKGDDNILWWLHHWWLLLRFSLCNRESVSKANFRSGSLLERQLSSDEYRNRMKIIRKSSKNVEFDFLVEFKIQYQIRPSNLAKIGRILLRSSSKLVMMACFKQKTSF